MQRTNQGLSEMTPITTQAGSLNGINMYQFGDVDSTLGAVDGYSYVVKSIRLQLLYTGAVPFSITPVYVITAGVLTSGIIATTSSVQALLNLATEEDFSFETIKPCSKIAGYSQSESATPFVLRWNIEIPQKLINKANKQERNAMGTLKRSYIAFIIRTTIAGIVSCNVAITTKFIEKPKYIQTIR